MAVSITTRPAVWSAVKNPVVYKFTSTGHGALANYRIEVEVFRASDNSSLTDGVKFAFSPDASGITYADISAVIKAYLSAEWITPVALNESEQDTSLKFYIKYQELYDGSATSVVDDVANPRYAVLAGLQIPSANGNNLTDYVPGSAFKKFLTAFETFKFWRGRSCTLSFIYPEGLGAMYLYRLQLNAAGAIIGHEELDAIDSGDAGAVNRIDINNGLTLDDAAATLQTKLALHGTGGELLSNPGFTGTMAPWTNEAGAGPDWTYGSDKVSLVFSGAGTSDNLSLNFGNFDAGWYWITYNIGTDPSQQATLYVEFYNDGVLVTTEPIITVEPAIGLSEAVSNTALVYFNGVFDTVKIRVSYGAAAVFSMTNFSLKKIETTDYTELLVFDVEDPCDNPVMLYWKNSLGGDSFWLFEHGQEAGYSYSGSKKAKRMTLFSEHLTLNQWEALNELNTLGEVYKENIIEFTSTVNKSHKRDGAQVYMVDASGNKTGVIVIPTNNVINTKDEVHSIEIEIELPEVI